MTVVVADRPQAKAKRAAAPDKTFQCIACGRDNKTRRPLLRLRQAAEFALYRCADCKLVQKFPRYTSGELTALYNDAYYVFGENEEDRWARAVQQYVVHLLPLESKSSKRLLDVGCALGHFAALAEARGWRVIGADLSAGAVSKAATNFGLDVRSGPIERHLTTIPPCDVVFLGDVIEHVPHPVAFLKSIKSVLAPNGTLKIDTPNWNSRWRVIGGARWLGLNPYHINLFDPQSINVCLTRAGYTADEVRTYTNYRYETWGSRPEVHWLLDLGPKAISWRAHRFLQRYSGFTKWSPLRRRKPESLDDARRYVSDFAHYRLSPVRKLTRDNLIVSARAE